MKTITKAQYLYLKSKKNAYLSKNETVTIEDEEFEDLIQYKDNKFDNNDHNIKELIYCGHDSLIDFNEISDNNKCKDIFSIGDSYDPNFILLYNDNTFKHIESSEVKYKLKNNLGKLYFSDNSGEYKEINNIYDLINFRYPRLMYESPEYIENEQKETIIAYYKNFECEIKTFNIKFNNFCIFENDDNIRIFLEQINNYDENCLCIYENDTEKIYRIQIDLPQKFIIHEHNNNEYQLNTEDYENNIIYLECSKYNNETNLEEIYNYTLYKENNKYYIPHINEINYDKSHKYNWGDVGCHFCIRCNINFNNYNYKDISDLKWYWEFWENLFYTDHFIFIKE